MKFGEDRPALCFYSTSTLVHHNRIYIRLFRAQDKTYESFASNMQFFFIHHYKYRNNSEKCCSTNSAVRWSSFWMPWEEAESCSALWQIKMFKSFWKSSLHKKWLNNSACLDKWYFYWGFCNLEQELFCLDNAFTINCTQLWSYTITMLLFFSWPMFFLCKSEIWSAGVNQ